MNKVENKLKEILNYDYQIIKNELARAGREGKGTPQEISDRREALIRKFFKKYYPLPYKIVKGQICDSFGNESASVDCVILNPIHPNTYDENEEAMSIILSEGVDFAIECKSSLSSDSEIERVLKQCSSIRRLKRQTPRSMLNNTDDYLYRIPYIIWANNCYEIETLINKVTDIAEKERYSLNDLFNILVVDEKYIICNIGSGDLHFSDDKLLPGLYYEENSDGGELLSKLLWTMSLFCSSSFSSKNITSYYTKPEGIINQNVISNERLRSINSIC